MSDLHLLSSFSETCLSLPLLSVSKHPSTSAARVPFSLQGPQTAEYLSKSLRFASLPLLSCSISPLEPHLKGEPNNLNPEVPQHAHNIYSRNLVQPQRNIHNQGCPSQHQACWLNGRASDYDSSVIRRFQVRDLGGSIHFCRSFPFFGFCPFLFAWTFVRAA